MHPAKLLADENLPLPLLQALRALGHDVLTAAQAGCLATDDPIVLARAIELARAVVTLNRRHFKRLHVLHPLLAGIIICTRDDEDPTGLAARIDAALRGVEDTAGQLLSITRPPHSKSR